MKVMIFSDDCHIASSSLDNRDIALASIFGPIKSEIRPNNRLLCKTSDDCFWLNYMSEEDYMNECALNAFEAEHC